MAGVVLHMVAFRVPADVEVLVPAIVESVILEGEDELRSEIGLASSIEFGEDISEQPSQIHNEVESEFFDSPLPDEQIAGEDVAEDERPEVRLSVSASLLMLWSKAMSSLDCSGALHYPERMEEQLERCDVVIPRVPRRQC